MPNYIPNEIVDSINIEVLEKELAKTMQLRDKMCGGMFWNILNDDCILLMNRINKLKGGN
jgi:hypothetical protein